jgi:PAS domain S-box-containing protein
MEPRKRVNILLVDDQPAKLLSYETILSELGENLIKASSGNDALECLLKTEIAVVLVDVCMPELDGFELTSMIRNHPRFRKTAIILVSGLMTEDVDRLKGYVSGAVDYVSVPIVPEILRAKVSVFVDLFRKTEALQQLNQQLEQRVEERTEQLARAYEASHFLATIVESSSDAIVGQTLEGTIRTWNRSAERLFGYDSTEMLGHNISRLTPPDRIGEECRVIDKLLNGETVEPFETVRQRKDGGTVEISLTISLIRDAAGEVIGTSQAARDITEQKRTAELLLQTQKLESLGVLAGGIAHDFNNLLVGILGNASIALDGLPANSPVKTPLAQILSAGESAAGLTRQMLAYSGRGQFVMSQMDLSSRVREAIPLIQAAISRTVELRLHLAEGLPAIEADATQVQQILMNLIINGAEAIPAGQRGTVTISTRTQQVDDAFVRDQTGLAGADLKRGTYVAVEVHDNGAGMDDSTKARIFEPFFTTKFTGRGLGLAAVLGIVRGHEGSIHIASTPGQGTTFTVLFPALASAAGQQPAEGTGTQYSGDGVVLVIDDEEIVRSVAMYTLRRAGYTPILAEDGEHGVEALRRNMETVDCILLDGTMPGISAEETLARLKAINSGIPVLLISGFSETEMLRRFKGQELAGFLQKPFKAHDLLEKLKPILATRNALRGAVGPH